MKNISLLIESYQGRRGKSILNLSNTIKRTLPNTTTRVTCTGTRLSSKFNLKDIKQLDNNSHLLRYARMKGHSPVSMEDFSILSKNLQKLLFQRLL